MDEGIQCTVYVLKKLLIHIGETHDIIRKKRNLYFPTWPNSNQYDAKEKNGNQNT